MHFRAGRIVFEQILLHRCVYSMNELLKGVKMPKITIFQTAKVPQKVATMVPIVCGMFSTYVNLIHFGVNSCCKFPWKDFRVGEVGDIVENDCFR